MLPTLFVATMLAAPPAIPSPKELQAGDIALFDGESTFGWTVVGPSKVETGVWTLGGATPTTAETTLAFPDGTTQFDVSPLGVNTNVRISWGAIKNIELKAAGPHMGGTVGGGIYPFKIIVPAGQQVVIKRFTHTPAGVAPIFNGKDLAGWTVFPGKKSTFRVTPEGWINVKDGPGDLQTEKQYGDFLLQGECISNGKHLNSGVFFRCLPGQYQQGYEMQVRNQWEGDDRTKPVDYGTGAIYRRQSARKVVSSDNEWFTFALLARGNRFATWVNGVQVTDWTDDRKEHENGRNGFKQGAGHLSIQGHDPTTDLSFRNLRVVELK